MSTPTPGAGARRSRREAGRKTIPLNERDLADLDRLRHSPEAAERLGVSTQVSERAFLAAAVSRGLQEAREADQAAGYALLAADPEERALAEQERARVRRNRSRELSE